MVQDFYELRHTLKVGDVFTDYEGDLVKLDRHVPGDATQWYAAVWSGADWSYDDHQLEPSDLRERVSDPAKIGGAA